MPRQKLNRKPARRRGPQGQIQKPGSHDPEHQQGVANTGSRLPKSRRADNDIETERPRTVRKENPI
jgi:hypothetical protein